MLNRIVDQVHINLVKFEKIGRKNNNEIFVISKIFNVVRIIEKQNLQPNEGQI